MINYLTARQTKHPQSLECYPVLSVQFAHSVASGAGSEILNPQGSQEAARMWPWPALNLEHKYRAADVMPQLSQQMSSYRWDVMASRVKSDRSDLTRLLGERYVQVIVECHSYHHVSVAPRALVTAVEGPAVGVVSQ